ncbi:hypothetical protein N0V90_005981 [Kalmusia sp. IMI 367209]|nr:hypothetical protein N0V90_005981 [Kalmusia sp. IMI 367209]
MDTKTSYKPVESSPHEDQTGFSSTHAKRNHRSSFSLSDSWICEIVCVFLGAVLILALYLVLRHYDGQTAPQFGTAFGAALTLNTVAAIIVTGARTALLLPVAECVGQLKWIWFSKDYRQLSDMSIFDKASRGLSGGFGLLWRTRLSQNRSIAALGPFVMIFQIAIDPLSQQLITYQSTSVSSTSVAATIGIAQRWTDDTTSQENAIEDADRYGAVNTRIKNAVQLGLNNANESLADITPLCPGGNCTFDPYWSLAVCTRIANVSDHITVKNLTNTATGYPHIRYYVTPNQYLDNLGYSETYMNVTSATGAKPDDIGPGTSALNMSESIAFRDVNDPIADVFIIIRNVSDADNAGADHSRYGAIEFILEWCVQSFTTNVTNGVATTNRHNAIRNFTGGDHEFLQLQPDGPNGKSYTIQDIPHNTLQRYFQAIFNGSITTDADDWYATSDIMQLLFEPFNVYQGNHIGQTFKLENGLRGTDQTGLEHIINNIATSLTNRVRSVAWTSGPEGYQYSPPARGTVYQQVLIVVIRWKWIAGHITFTTLSLAFLALTILNQHRSALNTKTWKSSGAAVLRALDPALQRELGGITSRSVMDAQDEAVMVRMVPTEEGGWRLTTRENQHIPLGSI